jgi:hypothetical protein
MTTWYICGGFIFCLRRSRTTTSLLSVVGSRTCGTEGITGDLVAIIRFYRTLENATAQEENGDS